MAYHIEPNTKDIVINGFEQGIANDPYEGISDMRNLNIISISKEASVNFATSAISPPTVTVGSVTSSNAGTDYLTYTGATNLENRMAVNFSVQSGIGIATGVIYWVKNLNGAGAGTFQLTTDYAQANLFDVTGNGTGTFTVAQIGTNLSTGATSGLPKYFTYDAYIYINATATAANLGVTFMQDSTGAVWSNFYTTTSGYWTYLGPSGTADTNAGSGLVFYRASNGNGFVFSFNSTSIDYFDLQSISWVYGWKPSTGGTHQTNYLKTGVVPHNTFTAPDNVVYYCDGSWIGRWYENTGTIFDPTNTATYTFDVTRLLPYTDTAQCLSFLGTNLMIGGINNVIYPWDTTSPTFSYPILLAEFNVVQLVTVNTNMFIFVGNRGRIYVTNGNNAQLYKKVPDHISGTVEPYFIWGGACSNKNQLYFSFYVTTNSGTTVGQYGGIWAIDLDSKAIRLSNELSQQTSSFFSYASALIPNFNGTAAGNGLFAGWYNTSTVTYGIDTTVGTPYTNTHTLIRSDLIPIGTFLKPTTNGRVEFKLAVPLVSGESITLSYRQSFDASFTNITNGAFSIAGVFSGVCQSVNFQNSQWIQLQAILVSTASSPSYVRLCELRLGN